MESMDNNTGLSGVPRCVACNKLYKKTEANEQGLCPRCLSEKVGIEKHNIRNYDSGGEGEQPGNPNALLQEDKTQYRDVGEEAHKGAGSPINISAVKPGQAIRERFAKLVEQGKIVDNILQVLTDKEATSKACGIRYAFLKEYDPNVPIKELTYINGAARYSSKPITVNGKEYLITNDLYKTTLPKFIEWADSLDK